MPSTANAAVKTDIRPATTPVTADVAPPATSSMRRAVVAPVSQRAATSMPAGSSVFLVLDGLAAGATIAQPVVVTGWAADLATTTDAGVDAVHVWAYPTAGGSPRYVGSATLGINRADIAKSFGVSFGSAGFSLWITGLAPGTYDFAIYVHSAVSATFTQSRVVRVTVGGN
jgi:hypothetical protein